MPRPSSGSVAAGTSDASATTAPGARCAATSDPAGSSTGSIPGTASVADPSGVHAIEVPSTTDPSSSHVRTPDRAGGGATNDAARTASNGMTRVDRSGPAPCSSSSPESVIAVTMPVASSPLRRNTRSTSRAGGGSAPWKASARTPSSDSAIGARHDVDHVGAPIPVSSSPTIRCPSAITSTPSRRGRMRPWTSIASASHSPDGAASTGSTRTSAAGPKATHAGDSGSSRGAGAARTFGTVSCNGGRACACTADAHAMAAMADPAACMMVRATRVMGYFWKIGR